MIFRIAASAAALFAFGMAAAAQISDAVITRYNAAAQSTDGEDLLPAARAVIEAAISSPDDANASLLAFEAGWTLCRNGECADAVPAAEFVLSQQETDAHPSRANRELLLAFARWRVEPNRQTRSALDSALEGRADQAPNLLTISAFQNRYVADLQEQNYLRAQKTAESAAIHLGQIKEEFYRDWYDASLAEVVAGYRHNPTPDALPAMARLYSEIWKKRHFTIDDPEWMDRQYYVATAWLGAMETYFSSKNEGKRELALVDEIVEEAMQHHSHEDVPGPSPHDSEEPKICKGELNRGPRPKYPNRAANRGYVGAVITLLDIDETGKITPRIGASVPADTFDEAVLTSLRPLKWKWKDPAPGEPPCVKTIENMVYPFNFVLDR